MTELKTTRRTMIAGVAALASVPVSGAALAATRGETAVARLWGEAESLKARLGTLVNVAAGDTVPGWMREKGEASVIGNRRYETLVTLLNQDAKTAGDLGLMARTTAESEIVNGPRQWAHERLAAATQAFHAVA